MAFPVDVWIDICSIARTHPDLAREVPHLLRMDDIHTPYNRCLRKPGHGPAGKGSPPCCESLRCGVCCGSRAACTRVCPRLEGSRLFESAAVCCFQHSL